MLRLLVLSGPAAASFVVAKLAVLDARFEAVANRPETETGVAIHDCPPTTIRPLRVIGAGGSRS
ncbi:MAG: hypothetical protein PVI35_05685 [Acidimicrobiia bacterium]